MHEPDRVAQPSEPSVESLMGRVNPKAWDHIKTYITSNMTIPQLHDGLQSVLGDLVFKEDIGFWNSVITDVTVENNDEKMAMRAYTRLRNRHLVSIYS
jgi:hypothetical protein